MKPYGREKNIKGSGIWKKDYRIRIKNRKIGNWWEDMCNFVSRSSMKRKAQEEAFNDIEDDQQHIIDD